MRNTALAFLAGFVIVLTPVLTAFYWQEMSRFFGPRQEAIRTDIIRNSHAYDQGMRDQLARLMLQYNVADDTGRRGIAAYVRDTYTAIDTTDYPANLRAFLATIGAN